VILQCDANKVVFFPFRLSDFSISPTDEEAKVSVYISVHPEYHPMQLGMNQYKVKMG